MRWATARRMFVQAYIQLRGSIQLTCQHLGIETCTFYRWRKSDPAFRTAMEAADAALMDVAESELHRRATEGK